METKKCKNCGEEISHECENCPKCGMPQKEKWSIKKILWGVVSFLIPLIGVVYFFIKKNKDIAMAKFVLSCAIGGFVFNLINYCSNDNSDDYNTSSYYEEESPNNEELRKVLNSIAGTYEIYENRGIQGFRTISTIKINSDGTCVCVNSDGTKEYYTGAHLNNDNTISFSCSDGMGVRYRLTSFGSSIDLLEDVISPEGIVLYGMRKR